MPLFHSPSLLTFWILASVLIGLLGTNRRLGFVGTCVISLLFSPVIGLVVLLASDPKSARGAR